MEEFFYQKLVYLAFVVVESEPSAGGQAVTSSHFDLFIMRFFFFLGTLLKEVFSPKVTGVPLIAKARQDHPAPSEPCATEVVTPQKRKAENLERSPPKTSSQDLDLKLH